MTLAPHPVRVVLDWLFLQGRGYQFWSIAGTPGAVVWAFYSHRRCHVEHCWRFGHVDPDLGHPACRAHHSRRHLLGHSHHQEGAA